MTSSQEQLGHALATCVSDLDQVLVTEIQHFGLQLSQRLATHFAEGIARGCGSLHNENLHLRSLIGQNHGVTNTYYHASQANNATPSISEIAQPENGPQDGSNSEASSGRLHYANDLEVERQKSEANSLKYGIPTLSFRSLVNTNSDESKNKSKKDDSLNEGATDPHAVNDALDEGASSSPPATIDGDGGQTSNSYTACNSRHSIRSMLWDRPSRHGTGELGFGCRLRIANLVASPFFEGFFNFIIVVNCFTMGFEAEQTVKGPISSFVEVLLFVIEQILTALFLFELVCRVIVFGWRAFIPCMANEKEAPDVWWNFMDGFLVLVTGVLFSWIIPFIAICFGFDADSGIFRTLTVLRAVRLLRLVRLIRRVPLFREAWLLLRGLTESMRTLFWTCTVIMFITYIFAVFGMVLITKELYERRSKLSPTDDTYAELDEMLEFVGGLDLLMYTLIQLLTLDSWNGIVRVLLKQLPWCWAYFYAYIAVSVFVLMNLVTAIIVENAVKNSNLDMDEAIKAKEKEKRKELTTLESLFKEMDTDGSGTLNWEEFKEAFDDPLMVKKWRLLDFEPDECRELFGLLDDGDGEIETGEFFEGLAKMKGNAQSKDIFRLQKSVDTLMADIDKSQTKSEAHSHTSGKKKGKGSSENDKSNPTSDRTPDKIDDFTPFTSENTSPPKDPKHINVYLLHAVQRYMEDLVEGRMAKGYSTPKTALLSNGVVQTHSGEPTGGMPYIPESVLLNPGGILRNLRI